MAANIVINGILGRMGREIAAIVNSDDNAKLAGGTEVSTNPEIGKDIGDLLAVGNKGIALESDPAVFAKEGNVFIDFTAPVSTIALANTIKGTGAGIVIGTTGLSAEEKKAIDQLSKENPVLFSPNMSMGVNFFFHLTKIASEKLGLNFDIEIIEAHHHFKKDSPSGTARRLGEIAAEAIGSTYEEAVVDGRSGIVGERPKKEIGMHAVRGGDIVGDHTVLFAGPSERIELKHQAHSRSVFAQGAVAAAKWLSGKPAGLYSMNDVLGI